MVYSVQTMHLSCVRITTISKWTKISFNWASSPSSTVCASKMISEPMVHLAQSCTYLALTLTLYLNRPKRDSTWASSPRSTIGCIQNDSRAYGKFGANCAPILHQDYYYLQTDRNELPLVHRHLVVSTVCLKWFYEPMVLLAQPCTYLALTLKLSPNGPKWASTWASSPRSTIGPIQNDFWDYGLFNAYRAPVLHRH
jgi:hypothetical protein